LLKKYNENKAQAETTAFHILEGKAAAKVFMPGAPFQKLLASCKVECKTSSSALDPF
jgi:hypothetical protein